MKFRPVLLLVFFLLLASAVSGQANGKFQLHFMDVGQGDGAILISPAGETVLFDNGKRGRCDLPTAYLQKLGVKRIDYMIASHYHDDHIGCTAEILERFPLSKTAYDRGHDYNTATYRNYVAAVGDKRATATVGTTIKLDATSANPIYVVIVALNGNEIAISNENDLSVVAVIHFGRFDAVMGGDLSGVKSNNYEDIETSVAPKVGQVEVYKVNHHGSRYSSNALWLQTLKPEVAVISTGDGNNYGHPSSECLARLHAAKVIKTYWTERGAGAEPASTVDVVAESSIVIEISPVSATYTVSYGAGKMDTYSVWPGKAWRPNDLSKPMPKASIKVASREFATFRNAKETLCNSPNGRRTYSAFAPRSSVFLNILGR